MGRYGIIEASSGDKHCDYNDFKRARYFHGMLMTDRDFKEEQLYHNRKRKLLNQMLHGWGVVCGLKVKPTTPPGPNIIIETGLALDCAGNEILVCEEQTIDPCVKPPSHTELQAGPCEESLIVGREFTTLYVMIKYKERITDKVPVYAPGGSCEEKVCDYTRTQEGYCIEVWDSLPAGYMPPPVTPESGETACMDPFLCPDANCCPDPHYILLATISCGDREDGFWKRVKNGNGSEIRYWVERSLSKVCIIKTNPDAEEDIIKVTDKYEVENRDSIKEVKWIINWTDVNTYLQPQGLKLKSPSNGEQEYTGQKISVEYEIIATADVGGADIKVPIKLECDGKNWNLNEQSVLKSTIQIGISDVRRGSTIFEAMIRNEELRKYVPTFPWFAWLLAEMGEEGVPWSGDVGAHCTAKVAYRLIRAKVTRGEVMGEVAKVKEDLRKEMEAKLGELEKKNADAIKKIATECRKRLTEMDNTIEGLTAKK